MKTVRELNNQELMKTYHLYVELQSKGGRDEAYLDALEKEILRRGLGNENVPNRATLAIEILYDAELMQEFDECVWIKVDKTLWNEFNSENDDA